MEGVFIFDDIVGVQDYVIKDILRKVDAEDLTKALINENEEIRKIFYRNMSLVNFKRMDRKLKAVDAFTGYDKRMAQKKILKIVAEVPEYHEMRFQNGLDAIEEFEEYLLERHQVEKPYGIDHIFDKDITVLPKPNLPFLRQAYKVVQSLEA